MAQKMAQKTEVSLLQRAKQTNSLLPKREEQQDLAGEKEKKISLEKSMELVMCPVKENNYLPNQLLQKKRKRKKGSLHL